MLFRPPSSKLPPEALLWITFIAAKTVQPQSSALTILIEVVNASAGEATDITQPKSISTAQVTSEVSSGSLRLVNIPNLFCGKIHRRPAITSIAHSETTPEDKFPFTA